MQMQAKRIYSFIYLFIYLLAQINIHKTNSNRNNCEMMLNGQEGSVSTYRWPQWSLHAKSASMYKR